MKTSTIKLTIVILSVAFTACNKGSDLKVDYREYTESTDSYQYNYEAGNWEYPDYTSGYTSFGNHRFKIKVDNNSPFVRVKFNPRRVDANPSAKAIIVADANTDKELESIHILDSSDEMMDLVFKPNKDSKEYYIYYLPHKCSGGYYPTVEYIKADQPVSTQWLAETGLDNEILENLPLAEVLSAQSLDEFHSFFPMEVAASAEELDKLIKAYPSDYYLFPEYRHYPIRMRNKLPVRWTGKLVEGLKDSAKRGEYFTFQVGVYSPESSLNGLRIEYSDLTGSGKFISKDRLTCFNTEGIDLNGKYFNKDIKIEKGTVQVLWFGIDLEEDVKPGPYKGMVIIQPEGMVADTVYLHLDISVEIAQDRGDSKPQMMSRMRWLNSTVGVDEDFIIDPFVPVSHTDNTVSVLGRDLVLNEKGLPENIISYFSQEMTFLNEQGENILHSPVTFDVISSDGLVSEWESSGYKIEKVSQGALCWSSSSTAGTFKLNVDGRMEYDGLLDYNISLSSTVDANIKDILLNIPLEKELAEYILGLGFTGQRLPGKLDWKWEVKNHQEGAWIGTINKGLQFVLRDDNYERPLNTNFYQDKPLNMPPSWFNMGRGGIRIRTSENNTLVENYSGEREIKAGESLKFNIRFLITPFKLINTREHFNTRFVHKYIPVDSVQSLHGTIVNVHHANEINPYINYPFYNIDKQKEYIDEAHAKGIKVKLYNTIRELTYRAYELFALRSLGDEILNTGEGGGHSWMQEHLRSDYYSAWHATRVNDAAILIKGNSRWTNYYIEGINWLAENQGMDGLYLDDIAFSRSTVKRIANVLSKHRGNYVIDLHSANQYNPRDGFINSAFLYMEHFPYVSRLWFGEYFDYYADPDYWFTEVSGLPFGLTGEMLQDGGRPYHGLIYGMTTRVYGNYNPSAIWAIFDDFGIAESRMIGYWVDNSPVNTENDKIRSTVFVKDEKAMIVLASWSDIDVELDIEIDLAELGYDRTSIQVFSPALEGLQEYKEYNIGSPIKVPAQSGLILVLE